MAQGAPVRSREVRPATTTRSHPLSPGVSTRASFPRRYYLTSFFCSLQLSQLHGWLVGGVNSVGSSPIILKSLLRYVPCTLINDPALPDEGRVARPAAGKKNASEQLEELGEQLHEIFDAPAGNPVAATMTSVASVTSIASMSDGTADADPLGTTRSSMGSIASELFVDGQRVRLHSLQGRAELNGSTGTVHGYDEEKQRFAVDVDGAGRVALKAANLQPVDEAASLRSQGSTSDASLGALAAAGDGALLSVKREPEAWRVLKRDKEQTRVLEGEVVVCFVRAVEGRSQMLEHCLALYAADGAAPAKNLHPLPTLSAPLQPC